MHKQSFRKRNPNLFLITTKQQHTQSYIVNHLSLVKNNYLFLLFLTFHSHLTQTGLVTPALLNLVSDCQTHLIKTKDLLDHAPTICWRWQRHHALQINDCYNAHSHQQCRKWELNSLVATRQLYYMLCKNDIQLNCEFNVPLILMQKWAPIDKLYMIFIEYLTTNLTRILKWIYLLLSVIYLL
jgi:hypothetical protein